MSCHHPVTPVSSKRLITGRNFGLQCAGANSTNSSIEDLLWLSQVMADSFESEEVLL
jgi:hypothetical protein